MGAVAARSREMMAPLLAVDARVAAAMAARSLPALSETYTELSAQAEASEAHLASGNPACGCDVALTSLAVVVGFAINKLDGEGRHEDWMRDESLALFQNYQHLAAACAEDAGQPAFASHIRVQDIETL